MSFTNLRISICLTSMFFYMASSCTHTSTIPAGDDTVSADEDDDEGGDITAEDEGGDLSADDEGDDEADDEMDAADESDTGDSLDDEAKPAVVTAPASNVDDSGARVVRYVLTDNTPAYAQADEKSKQVGTYNSGDPLIVKIMGNWAEISDNDYVRSSALSSTLVARKRSNPWLSSQSRSH